MSKQAGMQAGASSAMVFSTIKGMQAGRVFYTIMCDFATIARRFQFDDRSGMPPWMRAQRKIRESRIPKISSYILSNPGNYIFSAITVSVDRRISFDPMSTRDADRDIGKLSIPSNARILVNDGQHRCAAIRAAIEENDRMENERIAVVVFEDQGLKRSQQMFADLNKHAVKPTKSLGLLYDHRDTFARFIVTLANDVDIFSGRTEMERTNISNRSKYFVTLNGVAEATKHLLRLRTASIASEKQKLAVDYWQQVSRNMPEWALLMEDRVSAAELRKEYVHAHSNILSALGLAGYILVQNHSNWKEILKGLRRIDWRKESPIWQNKVVMDGKMLKNRLGIKRAANLILEELGVSETVDGRA